MKNIKMSVKEHQLTNEYEPKFKSYDYVETFDFESDDIELIYEKVNLFVHTFYTYRENNRSEEAFESASALLLDFDTKGDHNDSTINEFLNSNLSKKYNWFLYTSKSHIPEVSECFHVVFPLDEEIFEIPHLRATYQNLFDEVRANKLKCDNKVRDGARLIFPSLNESHKDDDAHLERFQFEYHYDGKYYIPIDYTLVDDEDDFDTEFNKKMIKHAPTESPNANGSSVYVKEFYKMSKPSQFRYIKSVVTFLNQRNRVNSFKSIDYNTWIGVGLALYRIFGKNMGKKLFRIFSAGHPRDNNATIDTQFDRFDNESRSPSEHIKILVKLSTKFGYRHKIYMNYYYMSRHTFSTSDGMKFFRKMLRVLIASKGFEDVPLSNARLFPFTTLKTARTYLLVVDKIQIKVTLSEMMDIMAKIFKIPRQFVTTAITIGIIRKFINMSGVYDIRQDMFAKIKNLLESVEGDRLPVNDVYDIVSEARVYAPSTIYDLVSNKSVDAFLIETRVVTEKKVMRIKTGEGRKSKLCTGYIIDKNKLSLLEEVRMNT